MSKSSTFPRALPRPRLLRPHRARIARVLFLDPRFAAVREPKPWFQIATGVSLG